MEWINFQYEIRKKQFDWNRDVFIKLHKFSYKPNVYQDKTLLNLKYRKILEIVSGVRYPKLHFSNSIISIIRCPPQIIGLCIDLCRLLQVFLWTLLPLEFSLDLVSILLGIGKGRKKAHFPDMIWSLNVKSCVSSHIAPGHLLDSRVSEWV